MQPLWDAPGQAGSALPDELRSRYGGDLWLAPDAVYSNFVSSLDGVVALDAPGGGAAAISGRNPADRFLMGLLRALADAVVVGAGTLRADAGHLWTPASVFPEAAPGYARLGRPPARLVVVTARGDLPPAARALEAGALVLTTEAGARRLGAAASGSRGVTVRTLGGGGRLTARAVLEAIRAEGHRRVLTEGGPRLMARFVKEQLLDEIFLTLAPVLAGRDGRERRPGMVDGARLLPGRSDLWRLLSLRAHGSHLFLRYASSRSGAE